MQETLVRFLGWEDPLEKGKATHSSILAWRIPWTVYPWGHKESDTTERLSLHFTLLSSAREPDLHGESIIPWVEVMLFVRCYNSKDGRVLNKHFE